MQENISPVFSNPSLSLQSDRQIAVCSRAASVTFLALRGGGAEFHSVVQVNIEGTIFSRPVTADCLQHPVGNPSASSSFSGPLRSAHHSRQQCSTDVPLLVLQLLRKMDRMKDIWYNTAFGHLSLVCGHNRSASPSCQGGKTRPVWRTNSFVYSIFFFHGYCARSSMKCLFSGQKKAADNKSSELLLVHSSPICGLIER